MAGSATNDLVRLLTSGTLVGIGDGELLARFVRRRDEAAFSALVDRLGPMVLGTCRRRLSDPRDVEDAFQATFLILARRAHTLRDGDRLGAWLHGVARKVAARAHSRSIRLRCREQANPNALAIAPDTRPDDARDLRDLIERELARLPGPYRHAFELCCLDGLTQSEAASLLRATPDQIRGRLERARILLRDRLAKQGIGPKSPESAPALPVARASVPAALSLATVRFVLASTPRAALAAALAREVLLAMTFQTLIKIGSLSLTLTFTVAAGLFAQAGNPVGPPQSADSRKRDSKDFVKVEPGSAPEIVVRGSLESNSVETVVYGGSGTSKIRWMLPDEAKVKKGDVVVQLDGGPSESDLKTQQLAAEMAMLDLEAIGGERNLLESEIRRLREPSRRPTMAIETKIRLAQTDLAEARAKAERAKKLRAVLEARFAKKKDDLPIPELMSHLEIMDRLDAAESAVVKAELLLESHKKELNTYLIDISAENAGREGELNLRLVRNKPRESAALVKYLAAKDRLQEIQKEISARKVVATSDGTVFYARLPQARFEPTHIRLGMTVRPREKLFDVRDLEKGCRVEVKFPEGWVDRLKVGQKVKVTVDAIVGKMFDATIRSIAPIPDPTSMFREQPKVYTVILSIDRPTEWLRPGMTTSNRFILDLGPDMLKQIRARIPRKAFVKVKDGYQVAVRKAGGKIEWRDVTLSDWGDETAGVKTGLEPGEEVARDALALLSDKEREEKQASYLPTLAESSRKTQEKPDARRDVSQATMEELKRLSAEQREALMRYLATPR